MLDLTNGMDELVTITEGFTRDNIHTKDYNMWLIERTAPTPSEKKVIEDVPFMQGQYDFSMIFGARVYENRPITYKFKILNRDYQKRKVVQTSLENWLMRSGYEPLCDDHAKDYHYIAKCESVDVSDDYGDLTVDVEFDAYPFKIGNHLEGNDIWDIFNFELDVAQVTEFEIKGSTDIILYNAGSNLIIPKTKSSSEMEIETHKGIFKVPIGTSESSEFNLGIGENKLTIKGNGTIEFIFYKELL